MRDLEFIFCGTGTSSGIPLIGASDMEGLYLNTGHGSLGWTMAAGSADLLAHLIDGQRPTIDPAPYAPVSR